MSFINHTTLQASHWHSKGLGFTRFPFIRSIFCTVICSIFFLSSLAPVDIVSARIVSPQDEPDLAFEDDALERYQSIVQNSIALAEPSCLAVLKEQLDVETALIQAGVVNGSRIERATAIYQALTNHVATTQATLVALLDSRGVTYNQFYLYNMIEIVSDTALCNELASHPDVDRIEDNPIVQGRLAIDMPNASFASRRLSNWLSETTFVNAESSQAPPYGLDKSGAIAAHAMGYLGSGITVASQDTGVQWNHPLLKTKYRGWTGDESTVDHTYNWYDVWGLESRNNCDLTNAQIPCDDNGHGTHTVGTMLGGDPTDDTLIGMAPEANWMGCRNMLSGLGRPSSYTECFEFFLAPFPQNGNKLTDGDPSRGPDIINNSWGCPPSEGCDASASLIMRKVVDTMRAAGQFVVASAGNNGSGCGTINQPIAMHDSSFSIGAHDINNSIASFSSRGPTPHGLAKPDISAPGVSVKSVTPMADVTGSVKYRNLSGTSMAAPHVAGAAALLWSAVPNLVGNIERTEHVLLKSANPSTVRMTSCAGGTVSGFDYAHGYGRLDIVEAIALASQPISITVNLAVENDLTNGVTAVRLVDQLTGTTTPLAVETGTAMLPPGNIVQFPNMIAGNYTVIVESGTGLVGEGTIQTEPGINSSLTITLMEQSNIFLPVLMGR